MSILLYTLLFVLSALITVFYQAFRVPSEYKKLKTVPFLRFLHQIITRVELPQRYEKLYRPILDKNGYGLIWQSMGWNLIVTSHKQIKEIMLNTEDFHKKDDTQTDYGQLLFKIFGRSNIVFSDKDEWRHHRRVVNPAFKKTWSIDIFAESGKELIDKIEASNKKQVSIHSMLQRLTLDVLGRGLFSYDFYALKNGDKDKGLKLYNQTMNGMNDFIYFVFPILEMLVPARRKVHKVADEYKSFLLSIIETKKKEVESGDIKDDIVSLMIKSSLDSGENALTNQEILHNLSLFFVAGHDTTANTLTSTIYFLSKYQDIQQKVREEILSVVGHSDEMKTPTHEQQKDLKYLMCVIKESMRFTPAVTQLRRFPARDLCLSDGTMVKKGMPVLLPVYLHHRNPEIFSNPEEFNPDRFEDPYNKESNAWMPFGMGTRTCVGINFSLIEQRVILSMLLQKYDLKLGPECSKWSHDKYNANGLLHIDNPDIHFIPRI